MGSNDGAGKIDECRIPGDFFESIDFKNQIQIDLSANRQWVWGFKKRTAGADILRH